MVLNISFLPHNTQSGTGHIHKYHISLFNQTINFTGTILSGVASFFVSFIFAIYLLAGKEKLSANSKRLLYAYVSEKRADRIVELASMTNKTFFSFVTGQLTEALILGFLCFVGMQIFSFPYPIVVSVLVGITALIPLFGAFIGTAIGAFLIVLSSPAKAFWFIIFIIVLQQVEGNLIYPRVVGKSVGLPGIWVLQQGLKKEGWKKKNSVLSENAKRMNNPHPFRKKH